MDLSEALVQSPVEMQICYLHQFGLKGLPSAKQLVRMEFSIEAEDLRLPSSVHFSPSANYVSISPYGKNYQPGETTCEKLLILRGNQ